jgi:hypothetical protein
MLKYERIREEDYWMFPIVLFNVLCGVVAIYASVPAFRVPGILGFCLGLWFTSNKVRRDYSPTRARMHVAGTVVLSLLLTWFVFVLTN